MYSIICLPNCFVFFFSAVLFVTQFSCFIFAIRVSVCVHRPYSLPLPLFPVTLRAKHQDIIVVIAFTPRTFFLPKPINKWKQNIILYIHVLLSLSLSLFFFCFCYSRENVPKCGGFLCPRDQVANVDAGRSPTLVVETQTQTEVAHKKFTRKFKKPMAWAHGCYPYHRHTYTVIAHRGVSRDCLLCCVQ